MNWFLNLLVRNVIEREIEREKVQMKPSIIRVLSLVENLFLKNPLQDLLSSLNAAISTKESTWIITGHVIYDPAYTYKFQLNTTQLSF